MPGVMEQPTVSVRTSRGETLAETVRIADRFRTRLVGLLGTRFLPDGHGLLIQPGGGVHTIGMRYMIDVMFLDADNTVLGLCAEVAPNRFRMAPRGCAAVLEVGAGCIGHHGIQPGERLVFGDDTRHRWTAEGTRNEH